MAFEREGRGLAVFAVCAVLGCSGGEELTTGGFTTVLTVPPSTNPATTGDGTTSMPGGTDSDPGQGSDIGTDSEALTEPTTGATTTAAATATATMPQPICGNGTVEGDEMCDDGNAVETDECLSDCVPASCGDLFVQAGVETCDDGNMVDTDACLSTCVLAKCGDGVVQAGAEACDDGNAVDNDACSNTCKSANCGDGVLQMGEQCDDMNAANDDACLNTCATATCGDGILRTGVEQCDGGGETALCNADCTQRACGDGKVNATAGEQCDTGAQSATCDGDCTAVKCGDSLVNAAAGEQCDDGNTGNGDGCSGACQVEVVQVCTQGNDPKSGSPWVVCGANQNNIWIGHANPGGGTYRAQKICADLGYPNLTAYGGTCGAVCSYCQGGTSCNNPGAANFDGGGLAGSDEFGPILAVTVMWSCSK